AGRVLRSFPTRRSSDLEHRCARRGCYVASTSGGHQGRARCRNAASSPRVTGWSGQNRSFRGGLQPLVKPARARASMSSSNTEWSSPTNRSGPAGRPGRKRGAEGSLEHPAGMVGDPIRGRRQVEGAAEEGGQLPAGDGQVGAVPVVSGRVAALGQAGVGEGIYVVLEHRVVVVDERVGAGRQV